VLFYAITRRVAVIPYRRFGETIQFHPQGSEVPLRMGAIGCTETSVRNYHFSLRNSPEERSYLLAAEA